MICGDYFVFLLHYLYMVGYSWFLVQKIELRGSKEEIVEKIFPKSFSVQQIIFSKQKNIARQVQSNEHSKVITQWDRFIACLNFTIVFRPNVARSASSGDMVFRRSLANLIWLPMSANNLVYLCNNGRFIAITFIIVYNIVYLFNITNIREKYFSYS